MGLLGDCGRGDGVGVGRVARYDIGFEFRVERSLLQCSGGGPAEDIGPQFEIVGTVAMGVAIVATTLVVSSFVFGRGTAFLTGTAIALLAAWAWCYVPLVTFRRR